MSSSSFNVQSVARVVRQHLRHSAPAFHLKAPYGWMNDPCAPGFDVSTGTYHLFYQWNPKSCDWGHICWGHFTSRDVINWEHNGDGPVLEPSLSYDHLGIFTGCFYPTGLRGEKSQLSIFYSSVQNLPIHWTLPYIRNCEGLAVATSDDGGRQWKKSEQNPILKGEPEELLVTGFRDPFVAAWPAMDRTVGKNKLYGMMSGGVVDKGPTAFLYSIDSEDLSKWDYMGQLVDVPPRHRGLGKWAPRLGVNWECINFMTLQDGSEESHFLTFGSEGDLDERFPEKEESKVVQCVWMSGTLQNTSNGPKMTYDYGGILDHGNYYAPNSYKHPETGKQVIWGWLKEEELTLERREAKGWTGHLSIPRELFLFSLDDVIGGLNTEIEDIHSVKVVKGDTSEYGRKTIQTLGIRPLDEVQTLRQATPHVWSRIKNSSHSGRLVQTRYASWELETTINITASSGNVGFFIRHNDDLSQKTSIIFSPRDEQITVDRSRSNFEADINKDPVSGPFTLFVLDRNGAEAVEKLHLRVFCDGDVLEIFANDRFALSTVVYSDPDACSGISWFAEGGDAGATVFESVKIWEDLGGPTRTRL